MDFLSEFKGHQSAVNALRFSPNGMFLASAGDDNAVIVWTYDGPVVPNQDSMFDDGVGEFNVETWRSAAVLSGHMSSAMDLSWHPSSLMLTTGALDGPVILWAATAPTDDLTMCQQPLTLVNSPQGAIHTGLSAAAVTALTEAGAAGSALFQLDYLRYAVLAQLPVAAAERVWAGALGPAVQLRPDAVALNPANLVATAPAATTSARLTVRVAPNAQGMPTALPLALVPAQLQPVSQSFRSALLVSDHKEHTQGVAWDPLGMFLATFSADRSLRIYSCVDNSKKPQPLVFVAEVSKCRPDDALAAPAPAAMDDAPIAAAPAPQPLFARELHATFYRRLGWSPDGALLACPAGIALAGPAQTQAQRGHCAYVFARGAFDRPLLALPLPDLAIAVRFSPVPFLAHRDALAPLPAPAAALPVPRYATATGAGYHFLLAVATSRAVVVYRTDTFAPVTVVSNIHLEPLTDLAWGPDGRSLVVSSQDGYVSFVTLAHDEVGVDLAPADRAAYDLGLADLRDAVGVPAILKQRGLDCAGSARSQRPADDDAEEKQPEARAYPLLRRMLEAELEAAAGHPVGVEELQARTLRVFGCYGLRRDSELEERARLKKKGTAAGTASTVPASSATAVAAATVPGVAADTTPKKPRKSPSAPGSSTRKFLSDAEGLSYLADFYAREGKWPKLSRAMTEMHMGNVRAKKLLEQAQASASAGGVNAGVPSNPIQTVDNAPALSPGPVMLPLYSPLPSTSEPAQSFTSDGAGPAADTPAE
jgi:WD40 repeat protein